MILPEISPKIRLGLHSYIVSGISKGPLQISLLGCLRWRYDEVEVRLKASRVRICKTKWRIVLKSRSISYLLLVINRSTFLSKPCPGASDWFSWSLEVWLRHIFLKKFQNCLRSFFRNSSENSSGNYSNISHDKSIEVPSAKNSGDSSKVFSENHSWECF